MEESELEKLLDPKDKEHETSVNAAHNFTRFEMAQAVETTLNPDLLKLLRAVFKCVFRMETHNAPEEYGDWVCLRTVSLHQIIASCQTRIISTTYYLVYLKGHTMQNFDTLRFQRARFQINSHSLPSCQI